MSGAELEGARALADFLIDLMIVLALGTVIGAVPALLLGWLRQRRSARS